MNGPRMRASAENDWFTPSTSPCRAGSLRFEISAGTDGFRNANPITASASATKNIGARSDRSAARHRPPPPARPGRGT